MALTFDSQTFNDTVKEYQKGATWMQDIKVEFEDGPADVDALTLLRAYQSDWSLDTALPLSAAFCMNKIVHFTHNGRSIKTIAYHGGDFGAQFNDAPYLLDVMNKCSYGLLLKKLTPPTDDSAIVDGK